jgi:hypothetical protein
MPIFAFNRVCHACSHVLALLGRYTHFKSLHLPKVQQRVLEKRFITASDLFVILCEYATRALIHVQFCLRHLLHLVRIMSVHLIYLFFSGDGKTFYNNFECSNTPLYAHVWGLNLTAGYLFVDFCMLIYFW